MMFYVCILVHKLEELDIILNPRQPHDHLGDSLGLITPFLLVDY